MDCCMSPRERRGIPMRFQFRKGSAFVGASLALLGADHLVTSAFQAGPGHTPTLMASAFACGMVVYDPSPYMDYMKAKLGNGDSPIVMDFLASEENRGSRFRDGGVV